ncbi:hypothetical protein HZ326_0404 [Fusarium oxysporum f. sp. albedinis]|nr:hypothetical protein HZ326_0404 [Fusarium oxysporum f. sp. albedinis]
MGVDSAHIPLPKGFGKEFLLYQELGTCVPLVCSNNIKSTLYLSALLVINYFSSPHTSVRIAIITQPIRNRNILCNPVFAH